MYCITRYSGIHYCGCLHCRNVWHWLLVSAGWRYAVNEANVIKRIEYVTRLYVCFVFVSYSIRLFYFHAVNLQVCMVIMVYGCVCKYLIWVSARLPAVSWDTDVTCSFYTAFWTGNCMCSVNELHRTAIFDELKLSTFLMDFLLHWLPFLQHFVYSFHKMHKGNL
jgi:hypothetical protein